MRTLKPIPDQLLRIGGGHFEPKYIQDKDCNALENSSRPTSRQPTEPCVEAQIVQLWMQMQHVCCARKTDLHRCLLVQGLI